MNTLRMTFIVLISALTLSACQTGSVDTTEPKPISRTLNNHDNVIVPLPDIPDSDGDGVLDHVDNCPQTPKNIVVDGSGCPIVLHTGSLELEFNGIFPAMSSQLADRYDTAFAKIEVDLEEHLDAKIFIFGHATANELALLQGNQPIRTDGPSRRRANAVKNRLVKRHHIASSRIATYDCSDRYLLNETDLDHHEFEGSEAKGRRVTLKASTQVKNLVSIDNASDLKLYENYIKYCQPF